MTEIDAFGGCLMYFKLTLLVDPGSRVKETVTAYAVHWPEDKNDVGETKDCVINKVFRADPAIAQVQFAEYTDSDNYNRHKEAGGLVYDYSGEACPWWIMEGDEEDALDDDGDEEDEEMVKQQKEDRLMRVLRSGDFTIAYHDNGYCSVYATRVNGYKELPQGASEDVEIAQYDTHQFDGYLPDVVAALCRALRGAAVTI